MHPTPRAIRTEPRHWRFALTGAAAAVLALAASPSWALGLGRLAVQSSLGEALRAEIDITSLSPEEAGTLRINVASTDAYRTAGVDYNSVLTATQVSLQRRGDGRPYLQITSSRTVQDPFVDVILEITWASGRLVREYTLLFDPAATRQPSPAAAAPATPSTPAAISAAPTPAAPAATTAMPAATPASPPPAAAPAAASAKPRPSAAPSSNAAAPAAPAGNDYVVRSGDSLSKIAGKFVRPGVSLDQMLVALFRANPDAFVEDNMNRLKAGATLSVPKAETAQAITPTEAQQVIQAQSADFDAYRQRLASGVPAARTDSSSRQASGKVQAEVQDRKPAPATTDKLTLSKGAGAASAPEGKVSKEQEAKANSSRVAELSKNVEQLKKLSEAASSSAKAPAGSPAAAPAAPASAPAAVAVPAQPPAAKPAPAPSPAPSPVKPTPPAPAPAPAVAAAPSAAPSAAASASGAAPMPVGGEEPGFFASLLDNPLVLPAVGVLIALLAGLGFYRLRNKVKQDSGETSFLESRLQPDSFFGASGGQRIDTREAGAGSSSMSYSLSQLDAIGDVDPVAEADVYLAYGRDLQAEEILKEAMRATPDRLAVRSKLLEVYAKRRDIKGFELLATQLYTLTRGEGDDWARAQELGLQIDPENPLYQSGGRPDALLSADDGTMPAEPLGASTMPQSVLPSPSKFEQSSGPVSRPMDVDLDLDLDLDAPVPPPPSRPEPTQPFGLGAVEESGTPALLREARHSDEDYPEDSGGIHFDLPPVPPPPPLHSPTTPAPLADLDFSFDLDEPTAPPPAPLPLPPEQETLHLNDLDDSNDPLARKLELADEFRQIGDMEGARDLLHEVVAKAEGGLKAKAQSMLDDLGA